MKKTILKVARAGCLAATFLTLPLSCDMLGESAPEGRTGELRISFAVPDGYSTRAALEIPDTSEFLLKITDAAGHVVFEGRYGDAPESLAVPAGSCTVRAVSCEFVRPAFSSPQYGDEQCVVIPEGGSVNVGLTCRQMNAGIRLRTDSSFLSDYPDGVLFLKASQGKLMYGYTEKRTAYFCPGSVSLVLSSGGTDKVLMTRNMQSNDMLVLGVSSSSGGSSSSSGGTASQGRISVAVDTSRNWISESFVIGEDGNGGDNVTDALTVSQALALAGEEDVWVNGYVVGGDLTSSSASFEAPFSSRTNILLGPRSSVSSRSSCLSVQLPSGEMRDALNLVDNPELLGRRISLKGDIVASYYGMPGIKNLTEYVLQ